MTYDIVIQYTTWNSVQKLTNADLTCTKVVAIISPLKRSNCVQTLITLKCTDYFFTEQRLILLLGLRLSLFNPDKSISYNNIELHLSTNIPLANNFDLSPILLQKNDKKENELHKPI